MMGTGPPCRLGASFAPLFVYTTQVHSWDSSEQRNGTVFTRLSSTDNHRGFTFTAINVARTSALALMSRIAQAYLAQMLSGCDPRLEPNTNHNACFAISRTCESMCLNVVQSCGSTHTITYLYVLRPEKEPAPNSLEKQAARFQLHLTSCISSRT